MDEKGKEPKVFVHRRPEIPAAERITEEQFHRCPSDWMQLAKNGRQILVEDQEKRVTMVLGTNGLAFDMAEFLSSAPAPEGKVPDAD